MREITPRVAFVVALLVGVTAFAAVAFAPATAEAIVCPTPGYIGYYSDPFYTNLVGAQGTGCCGEEIDWGTTTKYYRCEEIYCLHVICPQ